MRNIFLHKEVPSEFNNLEAAPQQSLTLTYQDPAYYFIRSSRYFTRTRNPSLGDGVYPFETTEEGTPFKSVEDATYYKLVDISGYEGDYTALMAEIHFLSVLGMIVQRGTIYYVDPAAWNLLYNPASGLFTNFRADATPAERKESMAAFIQFMLVNVLPGQYWRAHYLTGGLPETLYDRHILEKEMGEIEAYWHKLYNENGGLST
jgi:hypothetical protein